MNLKDPMNLNGTMNLKGPMSLKRPMNIKGPMNQQKPNEPNPLTLPPSPPGRKNPNEPKSITTLAEILFFFFVCIIVHFRKKNLFEKLSNNIFPS